MKLFSKLGKTALPLGAMLGVSAIVAPAPAYAYVQPIDLKINQSYYLSTQTPIIRATTANPEIADIVAISPNAINIVAKDKGGTTTVNVWTKNGMRQEFRVIVSEVNDGLADQIKKAINLPNVEVRVVKERVLLTGNVRNQYEKDLAEQVARLYINESSSSNKRTEVKSTDDTLNDITTRSRDIQDNDSRVVNLIQTMNPEQINIEAMVVEVNADDADKLGITYGAPSTSSNDNEDPKKSVKYGTPTAGSFYFGESYGAQRKSGSHWYTNNWLYRHFSQINAQINALVERGRARIISRPNITTMSGSSAAIHIGGQVPYPVVSSSSSNVTVEYKNYGIMLKLYNPTVDSDGNVTSDLVADVSRLDWSNAVTTNGYQMPGLSTRSARTVVNIPSGMTMAIGGLLNSEDNKTIQKVPLLGDIPILGELFKYSNKTKNKSEIIILITPRVVNENTPVRMSDKMVEALGETRHADETMNQVDPNGPLPEKPEPAKKVKEEASASDAKAPIKERTEAILADAAVEAESPAVASTPAKAEKTDAKATSSTSAPAANNAPVSLW